MFRKRLLDPAVHRQVASGVCRKVKVRAGDKNGIGKTMHEQAAATARSFLLRSRRSQRPLLMAGRQSAQTKI